jgi:hypothetical protein
MPELSDALKRAVGEVPPFDSVSLASAVARRRRRRFEGLVAVSTAVVVVVGVVLWRNVPGRGVVVRTQSSTSPSTRPSAPAAGCRGASGSGNSAVPGRAAGAIQMVTNTRGWAVVDNQVVATGDGVHFVVQYHSDEALVSLDAIDSLRVWAVGVSSLFGSTDGGRSWHRLGEPAAPLVMVHFADPLRGWGVAGGALFATTDGGVSWQRQPAPCAVERVCFDTVRDGWLAAGPRVYRTTDSGVHWREVLQFARSSDEWHAADLQCTTGNAAWAYFTQVGGAMSHEGYAAYRCAATGTCSLVIKENYIGAPPGAAPEGPGSYPGPMSAIDDHSAAFVGFTSPAAASMATMVVSDDGRVVSPRPAIGTVAAFAWPVSLSFRSPDLGWLLYRSTTLHILVTRDGGTSWQPAL